MKLNREVQQKSWNGIRSALCSSLAIRMIIIVLVYLSNQLWRLENACMADVNASISFNSWLRKGSGRLYSCPWEERVLLNHTLVEKSPEHCHSLPACIMDACNDLVFSSSFKNPGRLLAETYFWGGQHTSFDLELPKHNFYPRKEASVAKIWKKG